MIVDTRADWHGARLISFEVAASLAEEFITLGVASGRRLTRNVVALCDLPHYASSALDGWAVRGAPPWRVAARDELDDGECAPIVTGGQIPAGATGILRHERACQSSDDPSLITPSPEARDDEPRVGEHIRAAATEARMGQLLIPTRTTVNPAQVALAAAAGHDGFWVSAVPRVGLILTGDEVVASGIPGPGTVRDSFDPMLPAVLNELGATTTAIVHLGDSQEAIAVAIEHFAHDTDVIITTGGTGRSRADHLRAALSQLGGTIVIDGIQMRPGGPSLLAQLRDGTWLIGLPGNPLAAMMGLLTIGAPLLARMAGTETPPLNRLIADFDAPGQPATSVLIPFVLREARATATGYHGSAMMRGLAHADGVLVCPPEGISVGDEVTALALPWARSS